MKISDIRPLDKLDSIGKEGVFVRHRHGDDGLSRSYTCHLVNGHGLRMTTRVRPKGYPVLGTFYTSDGIPRIGFDVQRDLMRSKGLSVVGDGNCLIYGRSLAEVPLTPAELRDAVSQFINDVSYAVPQVDKAVQEYLGRVEQELSSR